MYDSFKKKTVKIAISEDLAIKTEEFKTLKPGRQLDIYIVDGYMRLLNKKSRYGIMVLDSIFFETFHYEVDNELAEGLAKGIGFLNAEVVMWPIHLDSTRCVMVVMQPKSKSVYIYDSLAQCAQDMLARVQDFLEFVWKHQEKSPFNSDAWKVCGYYYLIN